MNEDKNENINTTPPQVTSSLHTLEGDLLASMKDENYGSNIVKIVTQGSNKTGLTAAGDKPLINSNLRKYIFGGILGLFGLGAIYFFTINLPSGEESANTDTEDQTPAPVVVATTTPKVQSRSIFEADIIIPLQVADGDKNNFIQQIKDGEDELIRNRVGDKINTSFLLDINLEDLFNTLRYSGQEGLLRSLSKDQAYNFGSYHTKDNEFERYLLMKVDIFDLAFSGMLGWERTMPIDLERIFMLSTSPTYEVATSTSQSTSTPKFIDKVVKNIDTRTYIDPIQNVRITYGFINRQYILITSGESSFSDILNKLLVNNVLR